MLCDIDKVFADLSWNNSEELQHLGISAASKIKNLSVLIMPIENKSIWENCAKVLITKSDDELQLYFFELFKWLQDMNWPGAYLIYDRLIVATNEKILSAYKYSVLLAKQTGDCVWEKVLSDFKKEKERQGTVLCLEEKE